MRLRTLLLCTLALSLPLFAQTTKSTDGKTAEKKTEAAPTDASAQQMPKPSPEIKRLSRAFVGKWRVTGKILDEQWAPGGADGTGFETVRRGPGGFTIINDSRMDFGKMGPFSGHGVTYYDAAKKGYTGIWCDTWTPVCDSPGLGTWDGDKLVFNGEMQMGPQKIPMRQTYSNITKDGYDWLLEAGDGKGGWKPEMKLRYDRFTRPATAAAPDAAPAKP
jgi:hypothetical protein